MANDDDEPTTLSRFERTVLINQYMILEKLTSLQRAVVKDPDLAHDSDWKDGVDVMMRGYEYDYDNYVALPQNSYPEKAGDEASEILEMFQALKHAGSSLRFEGFDGNHEHDYMGYAVRFAATGRHSEVLNENPVLAKAHWNSHMRTLARYRRMMMVYKHASYPLTPEVVAKIEAAAGHQD